MTSALKKLAPHFIVIIGFIFIALVFFKPVLSGKMIFQSDIKLYEGIAKQHKDFRKENGAETYWNNSAFGGMPTYQLGAQFPHDYMDKLDRVLRFLPRPADYLFLYLLSFYILLLVMRIPWKIAILGSLAFGFSAYLIIIIGVGHNSKAHAIAYFPLVLAGILLVFQRKYIWGFLLTAVAMGLEIQANHYQMTYYLGLLVGVIGVTFLIDAIQKKILPHYFKSLGILIVAVLLGLATNATTLLSTKEYAEASIRGKKLLTENVEDAKASDGLDYAYITEYSYGILESLNLFVPKLMGLGRASDLGQDSAFYQKLIEIGQPKQNAEYYAQGTPLYWGDQPFVEAPPYLGVVAVALALLGLLLIKGRLRWWLIGGIILSLTLSWGKNFDFLTRFFVDYVPFYNKFRAVSSIQVILELLIPIAAVLGIYHFFNQTIEEKEKQKKFFIAFGTLGGLCLLFWLFGGSLFSFKSASDTQMAIEQPEIFEAIKQDRITIMKSDSLRSLLFIFLTAGLLWLWFKRKINQNLTLVGIGLLILIDLISVDRRSVNDENFITKREYKNYFAATEADQQILKDDSYFRVLDQARGFNNSHVNYFFNAINGYSAVRPRRMDDVYYGQIAEGNTEALHMLNVKYIIQNREGKLVVQQNPDANGPAWYVDELNFVESYNQEFEALKSINTKKTAIIRNEFKNELNFDPVKDSTATISISKTTPNHLAYNAYTPKESFVVFAEAYYENGWKATIDGTPTEIYPVNYMLRGIKVPAGKHTIEMKFEPEIVQKGSIITLFSSLLLLILFIAAGVFQFRKKSKEIK